MRKKVRYAVGMAGVAFLLSSCFVLQGFVLLDYTLKPTQATKARFTSRPSNYEAGAPWPSPEYEFVIVGVDSSSDLSVGKATWGTNGVYGGPLVMPVNGVLVAAMGDCDITNGLSFSSITGYTWKAFVTPVKIRDRDHYEKKVLTDVVVKAQADATPGDNWSVLGVVGEWVDDGNTVPDGGDLFQCTGIGSAFVHVIAG